MALRVVNAQHVRAAPVAGYDGVPDEGMPRKRLDSVLNVVGDGAVRQPQCGGGVVEDAASGEVAADGRVEHLQGAGTLIHQPAAGAARRVPAEGAARHEE